MTERTGQCMCGAVRFAATELGAFGVCHCEMCRRWTGSALFGVTVPEAAMRIDRGEAIVSRRSSDWATRSFCGSCGSPLWYRLDKGTDGIGDYEVSLGLFDDPNGFELEQEIFVDCKPDSYALAGDHKRLTRAEAFAAYGVTLDGA